MTIDQFEFFGEDPTNLDKLHPDLKPYLQDSQALGKVLHHPLVVEVFPLWKPANDKYAYKLKAVDEALKADDLEKYVWLHERPYRLDTLTALYQEGSMHLKRFKEAWLTFWSDAEPSDEMYWQWAFEEVAFATDNPKQARKHKGKVVKLYRGTEAGDPLGLAWSLSEETGKFFARRFTKRPELVVGEALFDNAYAYITGRSEEEVDIDPEAVTELERVRL